MSKKMKAAVLYAPYKISLDNVEMPTIDIKDVLVRVRATGVCGTDVETYRGKYKVKYPLIMGHEAAGEVLEVGKNVKKVKTGDRVILNPIFYCGQCNFCERGKSYLCPSGGLLGRDVGDGAYAEYVALPEHMVFKVPNNLPFEEATVIELLATVFHAQSRIKITPASSVVVLGQGAAGLLHTRLVKLSGAFPIIVTSRSQWKLELAKKYGADVTINPANEDPEKSILNYTDGQGADVVIEAAGTAETVKQAIKVVKAGGTILQFGIISESITKFDLFPLYSKEIVIVGSRALSSYEFEPCIKLVSSGNIDVKPLITHQFSLQDIGEAFKLLDKSPGKALRVIIKV